jgi:hypothetical protein
VLWCGGLEVGAATFVWRGVIGELGDLLALGVTAAMGEEVVRRLGGLIGAIGVLAVVVLGTSS